MSRKEKISSSSKDIEAAKAVRRTLMAPMGKGIRLVYIIVIASSSVTGTLSSYYVPLYEFKYEFHIFLLDIIERYTQLLVFHEYSRKFSSTFDFFYNKTRG